MSRPCQVRVKTVSGPCPIDVQYISSLRQIRVKSVPRERKVRVQSICQVQLKSARVHVKSLSCRVQVLQGPLTILKGHQTKMSCQRALINQAAHRLLGTAAVIPVRWAGKRICGWVGQMVIACEVCGCG